MAIELPNSVFYHMPKTGGTWVANALRASCSDVRFLRHPKMQIHHRPCDYSTKKFKFTFIRHPATWYRSYWDFKTWDSRQRGWLRDECWHSDYEQFLKNVIKKSPGYLTRRVNEYTDGVDFIGKQESLVEHLIMALKFANEKFDESVLRTVAPALVGRNKHVISSQGTIYKILKLEREIIERWYK